MPLKRIILLACAVLSITYSWAQQSRIDSLNMAVSFSKTDTGKVKSLIALSNEFLDNYLPDSALKVAFAAEKLADQTNYIHGKAKALMQIGLCYSEQDYAAKGIIYTQQAQKLYKKMGDKHSVVMAVAQVGLIYMHQGDYGSAIRYYTKAIELPAGIGYSKTRLQLEEHLGLTCKELGDYDLAITHYRAALNMLEREPDDLETATALTEIGRCFVLKNKIPAALVSFEEARNILNTFKDAGISAYLMMSVALAYSAKDDSVKAMNWAIQGLERTKKAGNKLHSLRALTEVGAICVHFKDTANATKYYTNAMQLANEINYPRLNAITGVLLATVMCNKDSAKKMQYFCQAQAIQRRLHLPDEEAFTLMAVCDFFAGYSTDPALNYRYTKRAIDSAKHAYDLYINAGNYSEAANAAFKVGEYSITNNLPVQALTYYYKTKKIQKRFTCMYQGLARTTERLGYTYLLKGERPHAYDLMYKAQQMQQDSGYRKDLWLTYKHRAMYFNGETDKKLCLQYYRKAIDTAIAVKDKKAPSVLEMELAEVYIGLHDTNDALELYTVAEKRSNAISDYPTNAIANYGIANIYYYNNRPNDAERHYLKCINSANVAHNNSLIMYCYYELYQLYLATNQKDAASQAYDNYRAVMKTNPPQGGR